MFRGVSGIRFGDDHKGDHSESFHWFVACFGVTMGVIEVLISLILVFIGDGFSSTFPFGLICHFLDDLRSYSCTIYWKHISHLS